MDPRLSAETQADPRINLNAEHLDPSVFSRSEWFALFLFGLGIALALIKWLLSHTVKGFHERLQSLELARPTFQTREDAEVKYESLAIMLGELKSDGRHREDRLVSVIESHRTEARAASSQITSDVRAMGGRIDKLYDQQAARASAGMPG